MEYCSIPLNVLWLDVTSNFLDLEKRNRPFANLAAVIFLPLEETFVKRINYFSLKVKSKRIHVLGFGAIPLPNGKLQEHLCYQRNENEAMQACFLTTLLHLNQSQLRRHLAKSTETSQSSTLGQ